MIISWSVTSGEDAIVSLKFSLQRKQKFDEKLAEGENIHQCSKLELASFKKVLPFCSSDKTKAPKLRNEVNSQGDFLSIHYFSWNNVEWLGDENLIKPSPWLTRVSCMWPRKGLIKETIKIAFRKIKSERPNDQFGQKESMGGIFSRAMLMEQ